MVDVAENLEKERIEKKAEEELGISLKRGFALGIDLGTTNSCAFASDGKNNILILTSTGEAIFPSAIAYRRETDKDTGKVTGKLIFGKEALEYGEDNPGDLVTS